MRRRIAPGSRSLQSVARLRGCASTSCTLVPFTAPRFARSRIGKPPAARYSTASAIGARGFRIRSFTVSRERVYFRSPNLLERTRTCRFDSSPLSPGTVCCPPRTRSGASQAAFQIFVLTFPGPATLARARRDTRPTARRKGSPLDAREQHDRGAVPRMERDRLPRPSRLPSPLHG